MNDLLTVVLPVFILIGAGYAAVWGKLFSQTAVDGLVRFATNFAVPCLLFRAISTLDLSQEFDLALLGTYYTGSIASFATGAILARTVFRRPAPDAVAIGFACFFGNTVLLGLPILERAYGAGELASSFAIISIHAPFCYIVGVTTMEIVRADGGVIKTAWSVLKSVFQNALMIGIGLGFAVNLTGFPMPEVLTEAIDLMARAALPAALFGLGGVLFRYRPEGDLREVAMICVISLIFHAAVVWTLGTTISDLSTEQLRGAVILGAMAPGVNAYIFANMYGVARRVAATSVLFGTALCVVTVPLWLVFLP